MLDLAPHLLSGAPARVLLVVGPSLGTSVRTLWARTAAHLVGLEVLGWDLPGHGAAPPVREPYEVTDLADAVLALTRERALGRPVHYAGVSLGGAVGLELALRTGSFRSVASLCAAPRIGEEQAWQDRADLVRAAGTEAVVDGSRQRWFAPGFVEREPGVVDVLIGGLRATDGASYASACEALRRFDLREEVGHAVVPLLAVTGEHDVVVRTAEVQAAVPTAEHAELQDCGHLPPAEQPAAVATLLNAWIARHGGNG